VDEADNWDLFTSRKRRDPIPREGRLFFGGERVVDGLESVGVYELREICLVTVAIEYRLRSVNRVSKPGLLTFDGFGIR